MAVVYDYNNFVATLSNTLVIDPTDANFLIELPTFIVGAENRVRRDIDLLSTIVRDQGGALTPNSRNFTFPQHFVVPESINVFYPAGSTTNRKQLVAVTREWLDAVWGNEAAPSTPSVPDYYAMITDQQIIVGPPPDASYTMEVVGTIIPAPLSSTTTTTWISLNLPDLFFAAAMVLGVGWQKDYGAATDDPNAAGSWEAVYQKLLGSANVEEARRKYAAQGWTSKQPYAVSTPQRA